jgi:hypothetical protein
LPQSRESRLGLFGQSASEEDWQRADAGHQPGGKARGEAHQDIGHIEDFLVDSDNWRIRYVVVDTKNWWPGKKVLVAPPSFTDINWLTGAFMSTSPATGYGTALHTTLPRRSTAPMKSGFTVSMATRRTGRERRNLWQPAHLSIRGDTSRSPPQRPNRLTPPEARRPVPTLL